MNDPVKLVPTESDWEKAQKHKQAILEAARPIMEAMTNARADGFLTQMNFGEDAFHRVVVNHFILVKQF